MKEAGKVTKKYCLYATQLCSVHDAPQRAVHGTGCPLHDGRLVNNARLMYASSARCLLAVRRAMDGRAVHRQGSALAHMTHGMSHGP